MLQTLRARAFIPFTLSGVGAFSVPSLPSAAFFLTRCVILGCMLIREKGFRWEL